MVVNLKDKDLKAFNALLENKDRNINIADMLLTSFCYVDFLDQEFINEKMNEGLTEKETIIENIKANFEDDEDSKYIPEHMELSCLNPKDYINDYVEKLSNVNCSYKNYKFKRLEYEPYQLFSYDDIVIKNDQEISKVGYFKEKFSYLALAEGKNIWMSVNPNEINTMKPYIEEAKGSVLILGLGMGYIQYMMSKKDDVKSITIIEKNRDNIIFFKKFIAPIFTNLDKIKIIEGDGITFISKFNKYDYIFADMWFTPEDGLEYYLKLQKIEEKCHIKIHYWLENGLKQMRRRYILELIRESLEGFDEKKYQSESTVEDRIFKELYYQTKNITINTINDVKEVLK